jgi:hypothetical protein
MEQAEKDRKYADSYKAFYGVDEVSMDDVKRAYGRDKSIRKYERLTREASPVREQFKPLPQEMKQDPEFLKNMVKFYGDEDYMKMIMKQTEQEQEQRYGNQAPAV